MNLLAWDQHSPQNNVCHVTTDRRCLLCATISCRTVFTNTETGRKVNAKQINLPTAAFQYSRES